ncbi:hypothetical protein ACFFWC_02400 [Plantactinospora siamensis]|uniref:Toxin-antitoxin system HicB family antitoxin n=1 Tax=Plantactinospora siamensis TaxID=555372 RepID=A0ABV6NUR1_9ACTN
MELAPYVEALRQDLAAVAAPAGADTARAAELLAGSLDPSVRLCLLQVLTDAAAELTTKLDGAAVEIRLRDRMADLVVVPVEPAEPVEPAQPGPAAPVTEPTGDVTRITLRLAESLKDGVERAAAAEGVSVNAWLVRAVSTALTGPPMPPPPPPPPGWPGPHRGRGSRRVTGFAQA